MVNNSSYIGSAIQLSVVSVLSRTLSILIIKPHVFLLPLIIGTLQQAFIKFVPLGLYGSIIAYIATRLLTALSQGIIIYAVYQALIGERVSMDESVSCCTARLMTLCFISILITLCFILVFLAALVPGFFFARFVDFQIPTNIPFFPSLPTLLMVPPNLLIAVTFAIIPWFIITLFLSIKWILSIPACIVENLGVMESLRRSSSLTKGYRSKILILMIIIGLIGGALESLGNSIFSNSSNIGIIGMALVMSITMAFSCVMFVVFYYDILAVKDGISIDKVLDVFD